MAKKKNSLPDLTLTQVMVSAQMNTILREKAVRWCGYRDIKLVLAGITAVPFIVIEVDLGDNFIDIDGVGKDADKLLEEVVRALDIKVEDVHRNIDISSYFNELAVGLRISFKLVAGEWFDKIVQIHKNEARIAAEQVKQQKFKKATNWLNDYPEDLDEDVERDLFERLREKFGVFEKDRE